VTANHTAYDVQCSLYEYLLTYLQFQTEGLLFMLFLSSCFVAKQ